MKKLKKKMTSNSKIMLSIKKQIEVNVKLFYKEEKKSKVDIEN